MGTRTQELLSALRDPEGNWKSSNRVATTSFTPEVLAFLDPEKGSGGDAAMAPVLIELLLGIAFPLDVPDFRILYATPLGLWVDGIRPDKKRFGLTMTLIPWASIFALQVHCDPIRSSD